MKCYNPIKIKVYDKKYPTGYIYSTVPCGKCLACQGFKSSELAMRLQQEAIYYDYGMNGMFVTLTYDDKNIPSDYSVHVRDLQLFFKRLRRRLDKKEFKGIKIKHLSCGEYGIRRGRPHYHSIILGLSVFNEIHKKVVSDCWQKGFIKFGNVTEASIKYVVKYMNKSEAMYLNRKDYFKKTGRERPFRVMSQGLGLRWLLDNYKNFTDDWKISYDGHFVSIPRSYLRWLYKLKIIEDIHEKIKLFSREKFIDKLKDLCYTYNINIGKYKFLPDEYKYSLEYYDDFYKLWLKEQQDTEYLYIKRREEYLLKLKYSSKILDVGVA